MDTDMREQASGPTPQKVDETNAIIYDSETAARKLASIGTIMQNYHKGDELRGAEVVALGALISDLALEIADNMERATL